MLFSSELPSPRGPYHVGSCEQNWQRTERYNYKQIHDMFDSAILQHMTEHMQHGVQVRMWYPTVPPHHGKRVAYMKQNLLSHFHRLNMESLPDRLVKVLMGAKTNAYESQRLALPCCPVVIFSHGMYACPEIYQIIAEHLASNGFLVIAPYHTDGSCTFVEYENGESIQFDHHPLRDYSDADAMRNEFVLRNAQTCKRVQNISYILDYLDELRKGMHRDHFLNGRVLQVSVLGHSFGGGTALAAAIVEGNRLCSGMSLDGWYFALSTCTHQLRIPFFGIHADKWQWKANLQVVHQIWTETPQRKHVFCVTMNNSRHHDFSDTAFTMTMFGKFAQSLGDNPLFVLERSCSMMLQFFKCYMHDFAYYEHLAQHLFERVSYNFLDGYDMYPEHLKIVKTFKELVADSLRAWLPKSK